MGQLHATGILIIVTVLVAAGLTHAVKPVEVHGFSQGGRVRGFVRRALPVTEMSLAGALIVSVVNGMRPLINAVLVLIGLVFATFATYVNRLRSREGGVGDCECTAINEPATTLGVVRAATVSLLSFSLVGVAQSELSAGWVWPAGVSLGILITYVPTAWNMEVAHYRQLQQEHAFAYLNAAAPASES